MDGIHNKYDEQAELTEYLWRSYRHLMTDDEKLAEHAFSVESKFAGALFGIEPQPLLVKKRKQYEKSAYVQEALRCGYAAFQATVRDRIIEQMPDSVFVNRCPDCQRIVATPKAMQCFWCGKDWHEAKCKRRD
jgi:hypothetical protein